MQKKFPEWVNTEVVIKAIKMREEGMLSKQLNLWIENLLEIEKEYICTLLIHSNQNTKIIKELIIQKLN